MWQDPRCGHAWAEQTSQPGVSYPHLCRQKMRIRYFTVFHYRRCNGGNSQFIGQASAGIKAHPHAMQRLLVHTSGGYVLVIILCARQAGSPDGSNGLIWRAKVAHDAEELRGGLRFMAALFKERLLPHALVQSLAADLAAHTAAGGPVQLHCQPLLAVALVALLQVGLLVWGFEAVTGPGCYIWGGICFAAL